MTETMNPTARSAADSTYGDRDIAAALTEPLEKWANTDGPFYIHLEHPEFTALCPRSGYPDMGTIVLDYVPGDWVLELKAFKLFINGFRSERISHEQVTNRIAKRFQEEIQPVSLRVIGDFTRRGGVKTVITVTKGEQCDFPSYSANVL